MNDLTMTEARATEIAVEIRTIQRTARATVLSAACEIGKRLIEVKNGLPHGAFYDWLEANVDCSKRQAQNMMSLYEEYGRGDRAQTFADLSVSKAIALLAAPEEMREEMVENGTADELSVRQLKEEIQRQKEALDGTQQTIADLEKKAADAEKLKETYERDLEKAHIEEQKASERGDEEGLARLKAEEERDKLRAELEKAKSAPPVKEVVEIEVVPPETEAELERLREIARKAPDEKIIKARGAYDRAVREFDVIVENLRGMDEANRKTYAAAFAAAMDKMAARIREAGA